MNPSMDWSQRLQLLFLSHLCLTGSSKAAGELCVDNGRETEQVFSVSGDAAMLTSTLVDLNVSDNRSIPYNISWYDPRTGTELSRETGKTLVRGKTLWIFNITMEDAGDYVCVVRLPTECYKKVALLIVNHTNPEECGRPEKAQQVLTNTATSFLNCPLSDHIREVDNYSIQWYKNYNYLAENGGHRDKNWHFGGLKERKWANVRASMEKGSGVSELPRRISGPMPDNAGKPV